MFEKSGSLRFNPKSTHIHVSLVIGRIKKNLIQTSKEAG